MPQCRYCKEQVLYDPATIHFCSHFHLIPTRRTIMKNWFKTQATEVSALAGVALILSHMVPWWLCVTLGILAISTNDQKAAEYAKRFGAWLEKSMLD